MRAAIKTLDPKELQGYVDEAKSAAIVLERLIAASGVAGSFNEGQVEQLTELFGGLASKALGAYANATGIELTPETILALLPSDEPLLPADGLGGMPAPVLSGSELHGEGVVPPPKAPISQEVIGEVEPAAPSTPAKAPEAAPSDPAQSASPTGDPAAADPGSDPASSGQPAASEVAPT